MVFRKWQRLLGMASGLMLVASLAACQSEPPDDQTVDPASAFAGRQITLVVAEEAGNTQDLAARVIAEFISANIPGQPEIVVQNMPGGGGLSALQYVHRAKPDGLTLLFTGGSPPVDQLLRPYRDSDGPALDFDINTFAWIGGTGSEPGAVWVNTQSGIHNVDELVDSPTPVKAGANRPGSNTYVFLSLLREVTGAPIDIVLGYESGSDTALALIRNEVQLQAGNWSTMVANHRAAPDDVLRPLVSLVKSVPDAEVKAEFGDLDSVPNIADLATDQATKDLIATALRPLEWGRLMAAPPDTPQPLVDALRSAFAQLNDSAEFKSALDERGLAQYDLVSGDEVERLITEYLQTPEATVNKYLELLE